MNAEKRCFILRQANPNEKALSSISMKYTLFFVLAYTLVTQKAGASPVAVQSADTLNLPLVALLDTIRHDDQYYRKKVDVMQEDSTVSYKEVEVMWNLIIQKDSINTSRVTQLLDERGWPPIKEIGRRGSQTIFLVIQHADSATQEKYLPVVKKAVDDKKLDKEAFAMLEDRLLLRRGQKQIYGTQLFTNPNGIYYVRPMIDPEHVDERRSQMNMQPMSEYLKNFNMTWSVPAYEKALKAAGL